MAPDESPIHLDVPALRTATITAMPTELKLNILRFLTKADSTCLGLSCKLFYDLHWERHGKVKLGLIQCNEEKKIPYRRLQSWFLPRTPCFYDIVPYPDVPNVASLCVIFVNEAAKEELQWMAKEALPERWKMLGYKPVFRYEALLIMRMLYLKLMLFYRGVEVSTEQIISARWIWFDNYFTLLLKGGFKKRS
jgi:hypothetical protein